MAPQRLRTLAAAVLLASALGIGIGYARTTQVTYQHDHTHHNGMIELQFRTAEPTSQPCELFGGGHKTTSWNGTSGTCGSKTDPAQSPVYILD